MSVHLFCRLNQLDCRGDPSSRQNYRSEQMVHQRHRLWEKVVFRTGIYGSYLIGAWAIYQQTPALGLAYVVVGLALLIYVLRHFCVHCPYPCKNADCLMAPAAWVRRLRQVRPGAMRTWDLWSFPVVMIGLLPLFPQYWLVDSLVLLAVFWTLMLSTGAGFWWYKCTRCLFTQCPLNRTKQELICLHAPRATGPTPALLARRGS